MFEDSKGSLDRGKLEKGEDFVCYRVYGRNNVRQTVVHDRLGHAVDNAGFFVLWVEGI